jgi:hypothetical protein
MNVLLPAPVTPMTAMYIRCRPFESSADILASLVVASEIEMLHECHLKECRDHL